VGELPNETISVQLVPLDSGDLLPDLPLLAADGQRASLADFGGAASVLIFLRHLG